MTLQIGRVGLDVTLGEPSIKWTEKGDQVSVSGNYFASTQADARIIRQQLLGYDTNEFEPTVPVVWSTETTRTGYYRISEVSVDTVPETFLGYVPFSLSMTRVQGYASPKTESIFEGADRTSKPGGVTTGAWCAITTAAANAANSPTGGSASTTRTASGATLTFVNLNAYASTLTSTILPANWYDGAATLTAGGKVVVGRQIAPGNAAAWQIDNGLLKIVPGSGHMLDLYIWSAGAWVGPTGFMVGSGGGSMADAGTPSSVTVLRNAPEEVTIRLLAGTSFNIEYTIDLSLRRGSRFVSVTNTLNLNGHNPGVAFSTAVATAHVDANLGADRRTANDANGNRGVICFTTAGGGGEDLVNGIAYSGGFVFSGAIGIELGGSGSASPDKATDMRDQYWAAMSELARIVAA